MFWLALALTVGILATALVLLERRAARRGARPSADMWRSICEHRCDCRTAGRTGQLDSTWVPYR